MERNNKSVLLITGAIDIQRSNIPFTRISDTQIRLKQYLQSIDYALRKYNSIDKVVFVENTNFSYDYSVFHRLAKEYGKEFEVLNFQGNIEKTVLHGKGFGEMECINYAIKNSKLLGLSETFIKLTGRVQVSNFDYVIRSAYGCNSFYAIDTGVFPYVETILYRANKIFFQKYLYDVGNLVFDEKKMYLERVLYQKLHELAKQHSVGSFRAYRFLKGLSASTGKNYATKITYKISNTVYALFHKFDINHQ